MVVTNPWDGGPLFLNPIHPPDTLEDERLLHLQPWVPWFQISENDLNHPPPFRTWNPAKIFRGIYIYIYMYIICIYTPPCLSKNGTAPGFASCLLALGLYKAIENQEQKKRIFAKPNVQKTKSLNDKLPEIVVTVEASETWNFWKVFFSKKQTTQTIPEGESRDDKVNDGGCNPPEFFPPDVLVRVKPVGKVMPWGKVKVPIQGLGPLSCGVEFLPLDLRVIFFKIFVCLICISESR